MPAQNVGERGARQRVAACKVSSTSTSRRARPGLPAAQAVTAATRAAGLRPAVVDEVVERAEHEVEQVDVLAHARGSSRQAIENVRATRLRRRARLGQDAARHATLMPPRTPRCRAARPPRPARAVTSAPSSTPGMPAPGWVPPPDEVQPARRRRSRFGGRK